jgi:short-subunit dehydrogenase involved in D-alanine esterification of teichoic acids
MKKEEEILQEMTNKSLELQEKIREYIKWLSEKETELINYWGIEYPSDLTEEERKTLEIIEKEIEFWEKVIY